MSKIAIQKNISSGGKIKDALTRGEVFLKVLDDDVTVYDEIVRCVQDQGTSVTRIVRGNLNVCRDRNISLISICCTGGVQCDIGSASQRPLNRACQPAIN